MYSNVMYVIVTVTCNVMLCHFLISATNKVLSIGTAKAALSLILSFEAVNNKRIKRFMSGVFKLRIPRPRYDYLWDPSFFFWGLVTAHRSQTLTLIRLST